MIYIRTCTTCLASQHMPVRLGPMKCQICRAALHLQEYDGKRPKGVTPVTPTLQMGKYHTYPMDMFKKNKGLSEYPPFKDLLGDIYSIYGIPLISDRLNRGQ